MKIKSAVVLVFEPTVRFLLAVLLLHFDVNLVESKKFLMRLDHFVHKGHRVMAIHIGVRVDCGVADRLLSLEVVDEVGEVQIRVVETVDFLELLSVLSPVPAPCVHKVSVQVQRDAIRLVIIFFDAHLKSFLG